MDINQPIKVLIVEDEVITATAIKQILQDAGYEVVGTISSGEEAIEEAANTHPDLVLMDVKLKGPLDGVRAAQQIQTYLGVPVIYLTAHSDNDTVKRVVQSQPYGYLLKPFNDKELLQGIERALHLYRVKNA